MIISTNSRSWQGVMVIRLVIDLGELVKMALKRGRGREKDGWVGSEVWGLLSFVA
jgi:hypothetical protein